MRKIFDTSSFTTIADGTDVSAFLNPMDAMQSHLPWGVLGDMSLASGRILAGVVSRIHVHPVITQVTVVLSGEITVLMKESDDDSSPYVLKLNKGQAVVTKPGTFLQLKNSSKIVAEVLYIASPAFVFEVNDDGLSYDDAIILHESWDELRQSGYAMPALELSAYEANALRLESIRRLEAQRGLSLVDLKDENIMPRSEEPEYSAPSGVELRRLVQGDQGGFAECRLPAGTIAIAVRHRTVEELWYIVEGEGEMWRLHGDSERVDPLKVGDSIRIPVDTTYQVRACASHNLRAIMVTMPPWEGQIEAVKVEGKWEPTIAADHLSNESEDGKLGQ